MRVICACGMTLDQMSRLTICRECGHAGCQSCSVEIESNTYCRWCATSLEAA